MAVVNMNLFLSVVLLIQCHPGEPIKLGEDGGYEILIALEENTPLPVLGVSSYVNNLQTSMNIFSSRLWVATKNHFYLKSVDILLPSHWNVQSSTTGIPNNYQNADIRLSPNATYPRVDNPNVCGQPGRFMELPSSFFNATHEGPFGLHWKSLLHTWAMYRYGVHNEHGYIDDEVYPYFKRDTRSEQWTVTGCTNEPITGKFADITNPDDTTCGNGEAISNNCRFVPSVTGQNATSSLMHFHWIESVTEFCDNHNHNVHAQNKQNALCGHKSVMQVIRESPDYEKVTSPREVSVPGTTFRYLKLSSTPLLYILLDRGLVQGSFSVANYIPRVLASYLTHNSLRNTVAAVGAYPGTEDSPVVDLVPWSELEANRNSFVAAIGQLRTDGPLVRDFSRALVAVAEKIKSAHHSHGAVVLLVKYGADVKNFGGYLPESEVLNALNEGNIILNTIELNFPGHTGYSHLAQISQGTSGSYVALNNFGEAEANIKNVLNYMNRTLITEYTDLRKTWQTIRKETLTTTTTLSIPNDIKGSFEMFVSTQNPQMSAVNFSMTGYNTTGMAVNNISFQFSKSLDWNEVGSKWTYKLEIPQNQLEGISQVDLALSCGISSDCVSVLLARAQSTGQSEVKVEVFTSLEDNQADLSNGRPVLIFAKVTKNEIPVQYATVIALVTDTMSGRTTQLRLSDEGDLAPDAQVLDGIYSGYFAPYNDGQFQLSVTVSNDPSEFKSRSLKPKKINESSFARLLPVDQEDTGCSAASCDLEIITGTFSQTVELPMTFRVVQASQYIPLPDKIEIHFASDRPDLGQLSLYWVSPKLPGRFQSASSYELRAAASLDLLINDFENQTAIPILSKPKPYPSLEVINIDKPASTTYYAIRSAYRGKISAISNILTSEQNPITSPPTPTSSEGPTDSTTTTTSEGPTDSTTTSEGPTGSTTTTTSESPTGSTTTTTSESPTDSTTTSEGPTGSTTTTTSESPTDSTTTSEGPTDSTTTSEGPTDSTTTSEGPTDSTTTSEGPTGSSTGSTGPTDETTTNTASNVKIDGIFITSVLLITIIQISSFILN